MGTTSSLSNEKRDTQSATGERKKRKKRRKRRNETKRRKREQKKRNVSVGQVISSAACAATLLILLSRFLFLFLCSLFSSPLIPPIPFLPTPIRVVRFFWASSRELVRSLSSQPSSNARSCAVVFTIYFALYLNIHSKYIYI